MEEPLAGLLVDLLGLPAGTVGAVVADGTAATVTALTAARHRVLADVGWDVEGRGLHGAPPVTVVLGDAAHPNLTDALRLLGLGRDRVIRVRSDGQGRMRPTLIPALQPPAIVCTQVGEAPSGAIDPVAAVCAEVHDADAWVHVDGRFGLWAAASPATRPLLSGVEYADSWATDTRLAARLPCTGGLAFAWDAGALRAALEVVREAPADEPGAALRRLGRAGLAERVERVCRLARELGGELAAAGYPVLNEVVLDRVLVGVRDAEAAAARLRAAEVPSSGGTVWQGRPAVCLSTAGWPPTGDLVARAVDALSRYRSERPPGARAQVR